MVIAIIQALMSSQRLPGKVLKEIIGIPMISHIYARAVRSKCLDKVILATSDDASDDELAIYANENSISLFRGFLNNALDRYYMCAKENRTDIIKVFEEHPEWKRINNNVVQRTV